MPNNFREDFRGGQNNVLDPAEMPRGVLQRAVGGWYKPGDPRLWKQRGRALFGDTTSGVKVKGVRALQYDTGGTDVLIALSGNKLYSGSLGTSSLFSTMEFPGSIELNMDPTATHLSAAHYNDKWYVNTDGDLDPLLVVENDGTVRKAGMQPQESAPVVTPQNVVGVVLRPAAPVIGGLSEAANSVDGNADTFGALTLSSPGSKTTTWTGGGWTGAAVDRQLVIRLALQSIQISDDDLPPSGYIGDTGGSVGDPFSVTVKVDVDADGDGVYERVITNTTVSRFISPVNAQIALSGVDPDNVSVRATLTYVSGTTQVALRVYDVRLQTGSDAASFSTTTGIYYGIREYDETRGLASPIKALTPLLTFTNMNQVLVTLPTAAKNSNSTRWEIFRTSDGGTAPDDLGLVDWVDIAETTYLDDFKGFAVTESPSPKYPMLDITVDNGTLRVDQDQPPPLLDKIMSFKNSLIGIKGRAVSYALSGLPESWPEVYNISSFNLEEHDNLFTGVDLGEVFILGGDAAVLRISSLPRVSLGNFGFTKPEKIPNAPGAVGPDAMAAFSISGEPAAAWISHYGVHITNGFNLRRVSDAFDWGAFEGFDKSGWVLHYDPDRFVLVMAYSTVSGGENNRTAFLHVHPDHLVDSTPKLTWGHYGSISGMASVQVGNQRRTYSGHSTNGKVYLEDVGGVDASNSYDASGTLPFIVQTRRIRGDEAEWAALKAWLTHSDFGQDCEVAWTVYRGSSDFTQSKIQTVSLSGLKQTLFDVARAGDWHEVTVTHLGSGTGALSHLLIQARGLGDRGTVKVA